MRAEADKNDGAVGGGDRITAEEINIAIDDFSEEDFARLASAAKIYAGICRILADDLLQEAYARALDGSRTCGRGTNIIAFICGIMKSLASQENEARKSGFRPVVVMRNGDSILPDVAADIISPEQSAASAINDTRALARIEALVADDEKLQLLIEGLGDGMRGEELQDLLEIDEKGLAALRKKLKRHLQVAFPDRTRP